MKIYGIAIFLFIFNLMINLFNIANTEFCAEGQSPPCLFGADYAGPLPQSKIIKIDIEDQPVATTAGEAQSGLWPTIGALMESVYMLIMGIGTFITLLLNSTIFAPTLYYKFLCEGITACDFGTFMWTFAFGISVLVELVYIIALVEFASGRKVD